MYKRILVAVDGSDTSSLAMQEAIKLTKENQATLRIVYVLDALIVNWEGLAINYEKYITSIKDYGQSILNKMEVLAREAGIHVETRLIEIADHSSRIPEEIIKETIDWHADLLVIGTHGRHGFSRLLLGSVAEGVIHLATIPVLLIRGKDSDKNNMG